MFGQAVSKYLIRNNKISKNVKFLIGTWREINPFTGSTLPTDE
jgi:hypothetical protein